uniref:Uncharacterized protein n=1 Tax=Haemonchus contortus TaxID=6289 RepID=A0A7I5EAL1_HAECO
MKCVSNSTTMKNQQPTSQVVRTQYVNLTRGGDVARDRSAPLGFHAQVDHFIFHRIASYFHRLHHTSRLERYDDRTTDGGGRLRRSMQTHCRLASGQSTRRV